MEGIRTVRVMPKRLEEGRVGQTVKNAMMEGGGRTPRQWGVLSR